MTNLSIIFLSFYSLLASGSYAPDFEVSSKRSDYHLEDLLKITSEEQLKLTFPGKVTRAIEYGPEGLYEYTVSVIHKDTDLEVQIIWLDDSVSFSGLYYIRLRGERSRWKTKAGITLGTSLKTLAKINVLPFCFGGFERDYSGMLYLHGGILEDLGVYGSLGFPKGKLPNNYSDFVGLEEIESNSKLVKNSGLILTELIIKDIYR